MRPKAIAGAPWYAIFLVAMGLWMFVGMIPVAKAGPYDEAGIPAASTAIKEWASSVISCTRGPMDIANPSLGLASFGATSNALGPADGTYGVVSLGDGGSITLGFKTPIANGSGPDFAVYENGFGVGDSLFGELGFVEVSSDGQHFFRFPSVSLTPTDPQVGPFGTIDPTDIHDLAGKQPVMVGTAFDLSELKGVSRYLNINAVTQVRVIDVVGRIDTADGYTPTTDSQGHAINDPYPTPFPSGGFDLDAIAVLNTGHSSYIAQETIDQSVTASAVRAGGVPEPGGWLLSISAVFFPALRRHRCAVAA